MIDEPWGTENWCEEHNCESCPTCEITRLTAEVARLQSAINEFCAKSDWAADTWKRQPWIAALFDLRSTEEGT
jgi:hypothetical protein